MEFLGIGPLELLVIFLVALLLLGPRDMAKTGKAIGKTMRTVVKSPQWRAVNQTSREIRNLPTRMMREAGLDEVQNDLAELDKTARAGLQSWTANSILPPRWPDLTSETEASPAGQPDAPVDEASQASQAGMAGQASLAPSPDASTPPPVENNADYSAWLKKPD